MDKPSEMKDLDLTFAARGVWLVKVPKYVSECWKKADPGNEVGKVTITKSKGPADVVFRLNEQLASTDTGAALPVDHKFVLGPMVNQSLAILSTEVLPDVSTTTQHTTISEYKVAIEGKVIQRAECRPIHGTNYMALKREQLEMSNRPKKQIVQLSRPVQNYKPKAVHEAQLEYAQRKKEEGKKTRDEKEMVMDRLYAAFEKHQYYNVKDLVRLTNQPITFLKEILKEICVYNTKAPHKNMWELKEEYRHYKDSAPKDST